MTLKTKSRRCNLTCTRCGKSWRSYKRKPYKCRWCGNTYWNKPSVKPENGAEHAPEGSQSSAMKANEVSPWDSRLKEPKTCEVHGFPLQVGLADVAYGLLTVDKTYYVDKRDLFPNSNSWVGGGCIASHVDMAQLDFCPLCREAESVWHQMKRLLSQPLEAL